MNIEEIVKVQIIAGKATVNVPGFGVGMILSSGAEAVFGLERVRSYTDIDGVLADFVVGSDEYKAAALYFGQAQTPDRLLIGAKRAADTSYVAALTACRAVNDDFYALIMFDHTQLDVVAMAAYIEATKKIFGTSSSNADILTAATTDVAYVLKAALYSRTFCMYSAEAAKYPEAAWLGAVLPLSTGNSTWKFKQMVGIASDNLTDTQFGFAKGKNCNMYLPVAGVDITTEGVMADGEFIDIIRGTDDLTAQMEAGVLQMFVDQPKVPYTNKGITAVENKIAKALQDFVNNGFLSDSPPFSISGPDAAVVSSADKRNRVLNNLMFTATYAGAIHKTSIVGYLSF